MTNQTKTDSILMLSDAQGAALGQLTVAAGTGALSLSGCADAQAQKMLDGLVAYIQSEDQLPILSDGGMPMTGMTVTAMEMAAPGDDKYPAAVAGYLQLKGLSVEITR